MPHIGRALVDAFWAVDRALGGQKPPTGAQKFAARHPLSVAAFTGIPWGIFFFALSDDTIPIALATGLVGSVLLGGIFGLTALGERLRQRRLLRLQLWDGS